jgi:hypothetical protein
MDTIRLFFYSKNVRNSKRSNDLQDQYLRTNSNSSEINHSNDNLSIEDQSSSSEKMKSFFSSHPSSTTILSSFPLFRSQLETCSGFSTPTSQHSTNPIIAASASESVSNARSFTNRQSSTRRRRSSILNNKRRRSWVTEQNIPRIASLSPPMRRTKSHRYPDRIRKHTIKTKHSTEKLSRRSIQVNR